MFINDNNLKELPQADVIPPSLELDSATSVRGDNFIMKKEIWYDIPNYEGYFQISSKLRIRQLYKATAKRVIKLKEPLIRKICTSTTYPMLIIGFTVIKNRKTVYIHHLVASVFIPNPNNYPCVLHKDDNKFNYSIKNLEWGTHQKNNHDAFKRGRLLIRVGSQTPMSKINEKIALDIFKHDGKGYELRHKYNVSYTVIHNIKNGYTWNHVTGLPHKRKRKLNL